jgi:endonuclease/exonuclease/phosphatase family metal-dependent hydrolase
MPSVGLVCIGEITRIAAEQLRARVFPEFDLFALDLDNAPSFQIAMFYDRRLNFEEQGPLAAPFMPRTTRPMGVVDFVHHRHRIRFIACHWNARAGENHERYRAEVARFLERYLYDFVYDESTRDIRHVVVLGDFNTEPFGLLEEWFDSSRSHLRSQSSPRYFDHDVRRVRLYNSSWRHLGEAIAHDGRGDRPRAPAGTYYYESANSWHTFDQILVSGSLLRRSFPSLMERAVRIVYDDELVDESGYPRPFSFADGVATGISDHLPVVGSIVYE